MAPYRSVRGHRSFTTIFQTGVRRRCGDVTAIIARGEPGTPQVGVVAARKVGNAVRRNRAKRRLRAALTRVPLAADTAYVVVGGPEVPDVDFERLVSWVETVCREDEGE